MGHHFDGPGELLEASLSEEKRCLKCHAVHHGELLGAFSYRLFRKQPRSKAKQPPLG